MKSKFCSLIVVASLIPLLSCEREEEISSKSMPAITLENSFFNRKNSVSTTLNGDEGSFIELEAAQKMIDNFLKKQAELGIKNPKQAVFFGKEKLLQLLNKEGAAGLTFYFGDAENNGQLSLIITASDGQWNDISSKNSASARGTATLSEEEYLDHGTQCCPIGK